MPKTEALNKIIQLTENDGDRHAHIGDTCVCLYPDYECDEFTEIRKIAIAELAALEAEPEPMVLKYSPGKGKFCVDCICSDKSIMKPMCVECSAMGAEARPYWRKKPTKPTIYEIGARLIEEMPSKNWCISYNGGWENATFGVYNDVALMSHKATVSHAATLAEAKARLDAKLARPQPEKSAVEKLIDAVGKMPANEHHSLYCAARAEFDAQKEAKK